MTRPAEEVDEEHRITAGWQGLRYSATRGWAWFLPFENGTVTGDGAGVTFDDLGDFRKLYRFRDGIYLFGD